MNVHTRSVGGSLTYHNAGQYEDLHRGQRRTDGARGRHIVHTQYRKIPNRYIRAEFLRPCQGFGGVLRLAHHDEIALIAQNSHEPRAYDFMVIGNQNRDFLNNILSVAIVFVPRLEPLDRVNGPLKYCTHLRMPRSPK